MSDRSAMLLMPWGINERAKLELPA